MRNYLSINQVNHAWTYLMTRDLTVPLFSVFLQIILGIYFGHYYDMRIFMATGYLVGNGQNPYIAQDLTAVFQNSSFSGMTSIGYLPPWPLVLGILYRIVQTVVPNLMVYNLIIKIPVIAANIILAYLVAGTLKNFGANTLEIRRARKFMLLSPFVLYFGSAWGQFDSIVALLSLLSLIFLDRGDTIISAIMLALAVAFKPIALPILPIALLYLLWKSSSQVIVYLLWFSVCFILVCAIPFLLLNWDPTPIFRGWNAHFTVAGGMSFMTFYELLKDTYQLRGSWWLLGLAWIPAIGFAIYKLRQGIFDFTDLLQKSLGVILIFYLTRTWLSEPNIMLIIPIGLILTSLGKLPGLAFHALWLMPLVFTIFNFSPPQLLAINFPNTMDRLLSLLEEFRTIRLITRIALVLPWQIVGWWIVAACFKNSPFQVDGDSPHV